MYTEGCWGAPFPQHPARAQSNTHVTHSFRSSASTVALTPFPFLLVQYFPRRELHEHFSLSQYRGSRGGISGCSNSPWKGSLRLVSYGIKFGCCGRRKSCLWLVKSNVVIPSYPRQHSGTQRSRCRIPQHKTKSDASGILSGTCVIWVPSNHDSSVEAKWQVWLPNRETPQRSVPGSCLEDLNPRIRNMLLHKPTLQLF